MNVEMLMFIKIGGSYHGLAVQDPKFGQYTQNGL